MGFVALDPQLLPVPTFGRAPLNLLRGARDGLSTAGPVYAFRLRAWSALNGRIVRYQIRSANEHDFSVLCECV